MMSEIEGARKDLAILRHALHILDECASLDEAYSKLKRMKKDLEEFIAAHEAYVDAGGVTQ